MSVINPLAAIVPAGSVNAWHPPREVREHALRVDQVVRAAVAEGGNERVLLEMAQRRFWAETAVPLKTGQSLCLKVVATAPKLELKMMEDPLADRLGRLLHLIGEPWDLPRVLAGLPRFAPFLQLLSTPAEALTGDMLRQLLRRFAAAPEQTKGESTGSDSIGKELLEIHRQLPGADAERGETIARLLQQLELFHLCQNRLAQSGQLLLPLPLPRCEYGYLLMERGRPGGEGMATMLSLFLSLSRLGNLRIDLLYEAAGFSLKFCCESPAAVTFLSGRHEELKAGLAGMPLRGMSFVAGAENPVQALLRRLLPSGEGVLNARV